MKIRLSVILFTLAALGLYSCSKSTSQQARERETRLRSMYLSKYHPDEEPTSSGLYYIEGKAGSTDPNDSVAIFDEVYVYYEGYLIEEDETTGIGDGHNFDNTVGYEYLKSDGYEPFKFIAGIGATVSGFDEGVSYMSEGGEAKFIIPSKLGYGGSISTGIPAYSTLIFYVKLHKVQKVDEEKEVIE